MSPRDTHPVGEGARAPGLVRAGSAAEPAGRRIAAVFGGTASALGVQGIGVVVGLVSVPLAVGYLGAERYGAWVTIVSMITWLSVSDLGLGNQLTNSLSAALARDGSARAREVVSSAYGALTGVAAIIFLLGGGVWWVLDWASVLNVSSPAVAREIAPAVGLAFVLFCASLPLTLTERVFISLQRGAIHNGWMVASSVASLAALLAVTRFRGGLVTLVAATSAVPFVLRLASTLWLYLRLAPELRPGRLHVRRDLVHRLLASGADFFLVQIGALVLYSTDNLIIARVLGPAEVTPYAVAWRLFTMPNLILSAAFPYLWAAYADAKARGDHGWAVRTLRSTAVVATAIAFAVAVPMVLYGREVIRVWAGTTAVPTWAVICWMGVWSVILAPNNCAVCFLNAWGRVRWQVWAGLATACANVGLSIWWARSYGISGVIAATVVSYLALGAAPLTVVTIRVLRGFHGGGEASKLEPLR